MVTVVVECMCEWVFLSSRNPGRSRLVHDRLPRNLVVLQVFVVLQRVVLVSDTVERRTLAFLEACVLFALALEVSKHAAEIEFGKDSVVWDPVIALGGLPVVSVLE